ncbi:MAG: PIN domain-containing protein [Gemmatimonadota bacterium]
MRFWDASALVPLLLREPATERVVALLETDPELATWWASSVECASAVARLRREERLTPADEGRVLAGLDGIRAASHEVQAGEELRRIALRLLRVHPLRAADALQLAAALTWAGSPPFEGAEVVTLDERLAEAAVREGFVVRPES